MATRSASVVRILLATALVPTVCVAPAACSPKDAGARSPIAAGQRLRLRAPAVAGGRIEGTVTELDASSIVLGGADGTTRVPRQAITRAEVSTGRHRQVLKGLWVGTAIGGAWMAVACASYAECQKGVSPIGGGAIAGAVIGTGIGALVQRERWSTVPVDRLRVALVPAPRRGVQLLVSAGF